MTYPGREVIFNPTSLFRSALLSSARCTLTGVDKVKAKMPSTNTVHTLHSDNKLLCEKYTWHSIFACLQRQCLQNPASYLFCELDCTFNALWDTFCRIGITEWTSKKIPPLTVLVLDLHNLFKALQDLTAVTSWGHPHLVKQPSQHPAVPLCLTQAAIYPAVFYAFSAQLCRKLTPAATAHPHQPV